MASLFSARRKAKRIVRDDQDEHQEAELDEDTGPVVRKPTTTAKPKSKLRLSFNPGEAGDEESEATVKKSNRLGTSTAARELPRHTAVMSLSERPEPNRPSYSKSYLDELRNSTPSTPKDLSVYNSSAEEDQDVSSAIDFYSKFGNRTTVGLENASVIPSAAEIREKKERRARLAKEKVANVRQEDDGFIPLEDYDSDGEFKPQRMQVGTYSYKEQEEDKDTRLVRDDEDIAEGFDEFVEDEASNRILMSKLGRRDEERRERQRRQEMIQHAEAGSEEEDDDSDSDASLRHAYESAQTHHGMEGLTARRAGDKNMNRPRQPQKVVQVPSLATALGRLRELLQQAEARKIEAERRRIEIEQEKNSVEAEQLQIQKSLTELGDQLERSMHRTNGEAVNGSSGTQLQQRGLESLGPG